MGHIYLCMSRTLHAIIRAMLWGFDQSHCLGDIISEGSFLVTGKSLSEALLLGENMLCTKIVLNVRNNFCTQHVLPRFELGIFMY